MATTIQISDETWKELNIRKKRGETFDEVIIRMILEFPPEADGLRGYTKEELKDITENEH